MSDAQHWGDRLADQVIAQFPDQEIYTCAAGISPSGIVHFGNFRDVFTAYVVQQCLIKKGKKARLLFSWDDFDRFRKVPANIDPFFEQYVGLPYTEVPCPKGIYSSYAEYFEKQFEASIGELGIETDYVYQTDMYRAGAYDDQIIYSFQHRKDIAKVLLSFMPEKTKNAKNITDEEYIENFYPALLYSRFSGKDNTKILDYDGNATVTYKCRDTGEVESVDITKHRIVKLSWKIDWPMRWGKEGVVFEPGGADHATPGGSFDTSTKIAKEIFNLTPPLLEEYKFVGLQGLGSKMSGSKGNVVAPSDLLEIYTPQMLKWLYADKAPARSFELSFGKGIFRQYDEFDRLITSLQNGDISPVDATTLALSGVTKSDKPYAPVSFRQLLGLGQIVLWNEEKLLTILDNQGIQYDKESVSARLPRVRAWLEKYNPQETIQLLTDKNRDYIATMNDEQKQLVGRLRDYLVSEDGATIADIEAQIYAIPKRPELELKELATVQRAFFKDVYNLLIGKDAGPRLSTFLWAADRNTVLALLDITNA